MRKSIAFIMLVLAPSVGVIGQTVLTLSECRTLALKNNKQLGAARLNKEIAANNVQSARTKYLPRVSALAGWELTSKEISLLNDKQKNFLNNLGSTTMSKSGDALGQIITDMAQKGIISPEMAQGLSSKLSSFSGNLATMGNELGKTISDAFRTDTRSVFAGSIVVTQPLYMGGSINALNRIAELGENVADDNYDLMVQNTLYEIEGAYWLAISLKQKEQLANSFMTLVEKLSSDVHKMIDEGVATHADGLNIDVRVNEAEMAKMRVADNLALSKMLLCQLCGLPMNENITLADEGKELTPIAANADLENNVYNDRPEMRILHNAVAITEQTSKIITATYHRPQVALTGGYLLSNPNVYNGFQNKFSGVWNIGILVRMPLWDWRDGRYKLNAAHAATTIAEMERTDLREKIDLQVEQNRFKVREASRRLELANKHVASADENLRCANLGFHEGVMSLTDVMAAQTAWESAHTQKIDAEIEVQLSQVGLRKALGQLQ